MLDWQDGLPFSSRFGDVYFSADSGLEETHHVFLQGNGLPTRFAALCSGESLTIGETGFGTGLNFLCAWRLFEQLAPEGASLDFFSIEKFPLEQGELAAALAMWPELREFAESLIAHWQRRVPGWNRWHFAGGRVRLTLALCDIAEALPELENAVDAWFLDGFSPAKNPEMWAEPVLGEIARASRPGATLATYTSAGWVRRGLIAAGFDAVRAPGFGRKREMLRGRLPGVPEINSRPESVAVIGAGLAGCAVAHALAVRGIPVTLIDEADQLASGASGNPRGILHARFGPSMNELHRFVLASYGHVLGLLDDLLPVDGSMRAECGLLQLAVNDHEQARIARMAEMDWPAHLLQPVDAAQASALAGMEMTQGGLWFPAGGWAVPPEVCARLVDHPLIEKRLGWQVTGLERTQSGWRMNGAGESLETTHVVVCNAHRASQLPPLAHLKLKAIRGQISRLPATVQSQALHAVVCGEGYCAPAVEGEHVCGATHGFGETATDERIADHTENLERIAESMPALRLALGEIDPATLSGRAGVRCSAPAATPLIGQAAPGLYCSLAHGTRGLVTAGLAGEIIAAAICGQLPPLPHSLVSHLRARLPAG